MAQTKSPQKAKRNPFIRQAALIAVFAGVALAGAVSGVLFAYSQDLPEISELDSYTPETITRIHARGGELIGEFATQRRVILTYEEIPEVMRQAIIAAEDGAFFDHVGFNIPRIVITMGTNILKGDLTAAGASTITMQLARHITLGGERLGLQKNLATQAPRGLLHRAYRKALHQAGDPDALCEPDVLGNPQSKRVWCRGGRAALLREVSPRSHSERSRDHRRHHSNTVSSKPAGQHGPRPSASQLHAGSEWPRRGSSLRRKRDLTRAEPIVLAERTVRSNTAAPHFLEEVRQHLEKEYGVERLYEQG